LEAKTKALTTPETSPPSHTGGIPINLEFETGSSSSSEIVTGSLEDFGIEEVLRNTTEDDFPPLDLSQDAMDFTLFSDFGSYTNLPSPNPTTPGLILQSKSKPTPSPSFDFPLTSDGNLSVPTLPALRAFGIIATALDCVSHVYNPFYLHVASPVPHPSLPPNLHPTPAQITIPHHPLLDTLPWPSVREKLICIFALPSAFRPPIARDDEANGASKGIMQIVHDLDDFRDGVKVHGNTTEWGNGNELIEEAWEVGEVFYRNWWFALDGTILENTNKKRRARGLGVLKLTA
jgi:hypothetical protein